MTETTKVNITADGGVIKEIIQEGAGDETPLAGCKVSLHYTGKLTDGKVFDSSVDRGEPFEFELGKRQVIEAFDLGIATMKLGEKCNLICGPDYAYGAAGSPSIPPNSTLIMEVELLGWKGEDVSPNSDGSIERFIVEPSDKKRSPNQGAKVKVHLIGKYNGRVFEDKDVEFDLGEGSAFGVVEGVEIGLEKMSLGETNKFKIHPKYAFGVEGNAEFDIPPHATVEYIVKLVDCEKGIAEWNLSQGERLEQAKIYKEKGTTYFKNQNYLLAIKMYKKSIENITPCEENRDECNKLMIAAYNNIALCYQKTNDQFDAQKACNMALEVDAKNIKALFRRGQCNLATNELNTALQDFQKVIELDPSNKAAFNQIQICKHKVKESTEREKKIYANMFSKLGTANNEQTSSNEPDVLATCGEWTLEEAKREAARALEHDNIVMI